MELYNDLEIIRINYIKHVIVNCQNCEYDFLKRLSDYKRTSKHLCSRECSNIKCSQLYTDYIQIKCFHCGTRKNIQKSEFIKTSLHFCSHRCSTTYHSKIRNLTPEKYYTDEWREKISKSIKEAIRINPDKFKKFINNSGNTDSTPGKRKIFSSKGERELVELIKEKFPNIIWSSGGGTNIGIDSFGKSVRKAHDLYSKELKLIIEYDGIYHFKDIYGNLPLVQFKDKLLEEYCILNGWKLIRVNEKTYHRMKWKVIDKIVDMIINVETIDQITKLYTIPEI